MNSNYYASRRLPDTLMEELVAAMLRAETVEFKALFSIVHSTLRQRKMSGGGEEMLRLRTYDKLQTLVREGAVTKINGRYRGVRKRLLIISESLQERHKPRTAWQAPPPEKPARESSRIKKKPPRSD